MSPAYAESSSPRFTLPYVGGNIGIADVRKSGYSNSEAINAYGGFYVFDNLSVELWPAYLGQFEISNFSNTYSETSGVGATAAYRIDLGRLFALRPSVGMFYSQTEIVFQGRKIGEDSGTDMMLGLSGVFTIKEHVLVNINIHWFEDVSGSDIVMFSAGAGYQF